MRFLFIFFGVEDEQYVSTHNILAMNNLLVWCRLLQYLSMSRSVGVLIIMVFEMIQAASPCSPPQQSQQSR